jgi:general secretion pathway protein G
MVLVVASTVTEPIRDLKITKAQYDLESLQTALEAYKFRRGSLPTEQQGLAALVDVSLGHLPRDPWGNPYAYRRTGQGERYRIYSRGLDGKDDGGGGDDVTTTPKLYRCADYGVNCPPTWRHLVGFSAALLAVVSLLIGLVQPATAVWRWCIRRWWPASLQTDRQG